MRSCTSASLLHAPIFADHIYTYTSFLLDANTQFYVSKGRGSEMPEHCFFIILLLYITYDITRLWTSALVTDRGKGDERKHGLGGANGRVENRKEN